MTNLELTLVGAMIGMTLSHFVVIRRYVKENQRLRREVVETLSKLYESRRAEISNNETFKNMMKKLDGMKARNGREG